uniref:Uncharacterized protein n=1 Tax=Pseudomonas aeruginosa TaxID=287 RepID=Q1W4W2_PSEAI|nr:hypothetical protein EXB24 [Pseudomonas aeruginosa]
MCVLDVQVHAKRGDSRRDLRHQNVLTIRLGAHQVGLFLRMYTVRVQVQREQVWIAAAVEGGLAGSALWIVQLASSRHSVRVVNCLVIEAPFDDGAHNGRPLVMPQQKILGNRGGDFFARKRATIYKGGLREWWL